MLNRNLIEEKEKKCLENLDAILIRLGFFFYRVLFTNQTIFKTKMMTFSLSATKFSLVRLSGLFHLASVNS
jgi:hypothetical protein